MMKILSLGCVLHGLGLTDQNSGFKTAKMTTELGQNTECVHAGRFAKDALVNPVHVSTANPFDATLGDTMNYPRLGSMKNQVALVEKLCTLEKGAVDGIVTGSGMAAISTALLAVLTQGDHAVFTDAIYGGTYTFATKELPRLGIETTIIQGTEVAKMETAIRPGQTKLLYIETPSNPLLSITDIRGVVALAKKHGLLTMMDCTFATPIVCNPLLMGIDIALHSGTKYLGGHSDMASGVVLCASSEVHVKVMSKLHLYGGSLNPLDSYLLERSLKTLSLRVHRQNDNAGLLAKYLQAHPKIKRVFYPGLNDHPGHELAKLQMAPGMFGAMLSFDLEGSVEEIHIAMRALRVATLALSLGGVETVLTFPAETSHVTLSPEERLELGISDSLVRCSVGIEDIDDLKADFEQALKLLK